jgi:hypothetical protein
LLAAAIAEQRPRCVMPAYATRGMLMQHHPS